MKIGVMMRAIDQPSAFQTFVECIIDGVLKIDNENRYVLFYRTNKWLGRFSSYANAREILLKAPHKFIWDQVSVPLAAWRQKVDIIYNPKFSVPLISHCPVAMGIAEMGWRIWPEYYEKLDVLYQKLMLPLYCRKSRHFFPRSQFQANEMKGYLGQNLKNVSITPYAVKENFHPIENLAQLEDFRAKYALPKKFVLSVTRVDHPGIDDSKSFFPGKNVDTTLKAYMSCRGKIAQQLVIAGRRVKEYLLSRGFSEADFDGIHFIGFVPNDELPMLFNLADLFVLPSFFEGFGLTMLEAMACGCPVIASQTGSCPEISGGAAILADPYDHMDFAGKIVKVLQNESLRWELREKGLKRASFFNWERSARLVIEGLKRAAAGR